VSRLEAAQRNPSIEILLELSRKLRLKMRPALGRRLAVRLGERSTRVTPN
jgi:hypothetical protein